MLPHVPFEELKARDAFVWGSAPWERVAPTLGPVHEHIVRRLGVGRTERWLDVGTGTGALAVLAAGSGADVTGIDLAPGLIETAKRLAAETSLTIRFEVGDAEELPYADASFDVVASAMAAIFAPDHRAAAAELARVCRPGGRLGVSAWRAGALFRPVTQKYGPPPVPGQGIAEDWGREDYVEALLGESFELAFEEGNAPLVSASGEEAWKLLVSSSGQFKARAESLDRSRRDAFHDEFVEFLERHRTDGRIELPGPYVLAVGTRR
jgi:SAM-dependent methyltransferase